MTEGDIAEIRSFCKEFPEIAWSETLFLKEIYHPDSISIVAQSETRIVGYLCARVVIDECHLLNIAVHPDCRNKGIGTALIEELQRRLLSTGVKSILLELRKGNEPALALYRRLGFNTIALRRAYYINPIDDGVMMLKELK